MSSPALNLMDPRFAALRGSGLLPEDEPRATTARGSASVGREADAFGFARLERLPGNVGYLALRDFRPIAEAHAATAAAINFLADSRALVIDLRHDRGGDRRTAALLTSYVFDTEPLHFDAVYSRAPLASAPTRTAGGAPRRRYLQRDLYVLIGRGTSALGREFARNLERLRGATVVEEG